MTHPTTDLLLADLDGELHAAELQDVRAHLERCASCAGTQQQLRETTADLGAALALVDATEPAHWAEEPVFRIPTGAPPAAEAQDVIALGSRRRPAGSAGRRDYTALRRAAAVLLLTSAGAAAAVIGGLSLLSDTTPEAPSLTIEPAPQPPVVAAVSVPASEGSVHVTLSSAAAGTRIVVERVDDGDASVAVEGGVAPHVTLAGNRVSVDLQDAVATVRIGLPRALRAADVVVGARTAIRLRNGVVTPEAALTAGILIEGSDNRDR